MWGFFPVKLLIASYKMMQWVGVISPEVKNIKIIVEKKMKHFAHNFNSSLTRNWSLTGKAEETMNTV